MIDGDACATAIGIVDDISGSQRLPSPLLARCCRKWMTSELVENLSQSLSAGYDSIPQKFEHSEVVKKSVAQFKVPFWVSGLRSRTVLFSVFCSLYSNTV